MEKYSGKICRRSQNDWIEARDGDYSFLKEDYNIEIDSAQASKLTLYPAVLYRVNVLEIDNFKDDKEISSSLIVNPAEAKFFAFKDSRGVAVIFGSYANGKWEDEGYSGFPAYYARKVKTMVSQGKKCSLSIYIWNLQREGGPFL